ncbi:MAG: hypothetical protein QOJ34_2441 [Pseudonocardiales bacterium]|jgi:hypothetical protein|nr:hypothetical protein [Pseudonocardiales bacterium]
MPSSSNDQETKSSHDNQDKMRLDRDDEDHDFVDQSKIDFDPDDGLFSGTAVKGESEIPGPHEDRETGELTGMDEAEQPSSDDEAAREQAPAAGEAKPQEAPEAAG